MCRIFIGGRKGSGPEKACGDPLDGERREGKKEDCLKSASDCRAIQEFSRVFARPMGCLPSQVAY